MQPGMHNGTDHHTMESLKHECGVAMIRLRKPLPYYQEKYGSWLYGLNKLYLLMEKQHNRGQEGAGLAVVKLRSKPGEEYLFRERAEGSNAITEIFDSVHKHFREFDKSLMEDACYAQDCIPFAGECYMGHLRYSTTGKSGLTYVHPMIRRSNWRAKCLAICGNFNLTNVKTIFDEITSTGQHPRITSDTHVLLEQLGHRLDREVERLFRISKDEHHHRGMEITHFIEKNIEMKNVLSSAAPLWDGGYVMCGMTGSGEQYALRDPRAIRPAFYYIDDEIVVLASERPVIQTVMNVQTENIVELKPGEALLINQQGNPRIEQILPALDNKACSFERIYFSRGSDSNIYKERKALGRALTPNILTAIGYDLDHSVFSFIPNTAEVAYYGMLEGLTEYLTEEKIQKLQALETKDKEAIRAIIGRQIRTEKVAIKDIKLRTFITEGKSREDLAAHVYDITYGSVTPFVDNLVVIDDSIVRGTTLKQSILKILDRLHPKKIVVVSSSPQIRYPDYYGIDMRKMSEFIAFKAAVALIQERKMESLLGKAYQEALELQKKPLEEFVPNVVKSLYKPFSAKEISDKIVDLLRPSEVQTEIEIVYQSIEGLHSAIPGHPGDWYFTGDFPTPGGAHLVNEAYINYYEESFLRK